MKKTTKVQIPEVRDPQSEVAAAAQEPAPAPGDGVSKGRQAPRIQAPAEVEWNSRDTHVVKGRQYASDVWVIGPAQIELMASAYHKLVKLAETPGGEVRHVAKVRVGRVKGSKNILIRPTTDIDPDGLELKKVGSDWWVNAITILGPAKLTVQTGYRERFTVTEASEEVSAAPALQFNMGKPAARKVVSRKKAAQAASGTSTSGTAKAVESEAAKAEPKETEE